MITPSRLDLNDELNIYLVSNGVKPAGLINLTPIPNIKDDGIVKKTENHNQTECVYFTFKPKVRSEVVDYLHENGLSSKVKKWTKEFRPQNQLQLYKGLNIFYAKEYKNLEKLLKAKTDEEIGSALGFPKDATSVFQKVINNELICSSYTGYHMSMAKNEGIILPTWLAYITHIPEKMDFVTGNISKSSKALGEKYQSFVRKNNPFLADRIEEYFKFMTEHLPENWVQRTDKGYMPVRK